MRSAPANDLRVAAIVPAYNEEATLTEVLSVLKATPGIDEILVVSDGSTDGTVEIARSLGLRTIRLRENQGKGRAMAIGVAHTDAPVLLFVDGDILNLTKDLLTRLIEPVVSGRSDMNVGIRHRGAVINALHRRTGPLLSGVRCLKREVFEAVPETHLEGFAIETGLNWACRELGQRITTTVMHNLKHLVKEKKRGLVEGSRARYKMFAAVFKAWVSLKLDRPDLRRAPDHPLFKPELEYINF
ncbi:MAG TPA: glycosyltransferase family 2 protein [Thermoanaerobaculia bacterium]|nr:glycosyltransferase family 2 protein [Thermoanaerobaculia bacterium]HSN86157.1 glycosyltransferase family 2 protein [Thermoanaerobaculia bacterium]